ncbi:MAG: hypothetical protein IMZ53_13025 [Thermoplasmata archaeon]|nr:hypothetical protein [Thermoplasmata archaeon]
MKTLIILLTVLFLAVGISLAQEKKKETPKDTLLTLSLPVLDKQLADLEAELQKQQKGEQDAITFLEQTRKNIVQLQTTISTINYIKTTGLPKGKK